MSAAEPAALEVGRSSRRALTREFLFFSGSSAAFQSSRLLVQLLAAAVLAPADFAIWGIVVVILSYTTYANLGVLSGANRRIPLLLGSGGATEAVRIETVALTGVLATGAAGGVLALAGGAVLGGPWLAVGAMLGLAVLAQQAYLFYQVSLRGRLDFDLASGQQLVLAVLFGVVGAGAVLIAGVAGLVFAQALAYGLGAAVALTRRRHLRPARDRRLTRSLMVEGAPIMLSGLVLAAATSVDRWVLAGAGDRTALGQYSLAATISGSLLFISLVVAQQSYPRMAMRHGAGASGPDLTGMATRQGMLAVGLMAPVAAILILGAPIVIPLALPAYGPAVPALQLTAIAYLVLAAGSGSTNLLVSVGRAWWLLWIQALTAVVGAILAFSALRLGFGLAGVAGAMVASFALLTGLATIAARRS